MKTLKIRMLKKADIPKLAKVFQEAFNSVNQGWSLAGSKTYLREHMHCTLKLIALAGDEVVGFLIGTKDVDALVVNAVGVSPESMNKGIGKMLWNSAMEYVKREKLDAIRLVADPKSIAYQWYRKLGLKENGWVEMEKRIS